MRTCKTSALVLTALLLFAGSSCKAGQNGGLALSITTAAPHILVVSFSDGYGLVKFPADPLTTASSDWKVGGISPVAVHHRASPIDELPKTAKGEYPVMNEYSTYLVLPSPLVSGSTYRIEGPFGSKDFAFDESTVLCESLKVNQEGYLPSSPVRYANLGVYLGDGGSLLFPTPPSYQVLDRDKATVVHSGIAEYKGDDTAVSSKNVSSGEHVYRLDLSEVPPGEGYVVRLEGAGISHPFDISYQTVEKIAATYARFLYHQRCGIALEEPYTHHTRPVCHPEVALTKTPWSKGGGITVAGTEPLVPIQGGYHDAGDFDRRPYHTIIPILLLGYYEAFPSHFIDGQYNIPESGNGLPDILDEALWGVLLWENLQILDPQDSEVGSIMAGTETSRHPEYSRVNAATDPLVYGTWAPSAEVTAFGSGMMAQSARLLASFEGEENRSEELYRRSQLAFAALANHRSDTGEPYLEQKSAALLYASLQNALAVEMFEPENLPRRKELQDLFSQLAETLVVMDGFWPEQYRPGNLTAKIQTVHFSSFLLSEPSFDERLREKLQQRVFKEASHGGYMGFDSTFPYYAQGATKAYGWGAGSAQGRYADVVAFAYRLEEQEEQRQRYLGILSQFGDYALGLNPLGQSFVTGLGTKQPASPLHLDSWFTRKGEPGTVVPGILVYGPSLDRSSAEYQKVVSDLLYPRWSELPLQRRWADGWSLVNNNEFTVWETSVWNLVLYGVLYDAGLHGC
ncbi:MAG: glycoside hydrolase family 9 protein [Sphaerochaeta sp.]|nr:glycoside hydrolase family 9 protein [Sphaerochaeta sp.]